MEHSCGWKGGTYIFSYNFSHCRQVSLLYYLGSSTDTGLLGAVCAPFTLCGLMHQLFSQPPFFDTHYNKQNEQLFLTLDLREPVWLVVVLRGNGEGVEEHEEDHQPVENIGLDSSTALPSAESIPSAPVAT